MIFLGKPPNTTGGPGSPDGKPRTTGALENHWGGDIPCGSKFSPFVSAAWSLFDRGYLGVDPRHRLLVSPRLRADFSNGDQFYAKAGQVIDLPEHRTDRPGREFLEWHLDEVFLRAGAT